MFHFSEQNTEFSAPPVKYSGLGDECLQNSNSSVCEVADSQCVDSGDLDSKFRCKCKSDYIVTQLDGVPICGEYEANFPLWGLTRVAPQMRDLMLI